MVVGSSPILCFLLNAAHGSLIRMTSIFQVLTDFHCPPCGELSAVVNIYGLFELRHYSISIMSVIAMKHAVIFVKYLFLPLHANEKRLAP